MRLIHMQSLQYFMFVDMVVGYVNYISFFST
jgi:hypothetical protein